VKTKLATLHFLGLNQILKVFILKVAIKVDQSTSTFGMLGPLAKKLCKLYLAKIDIFLGWFNNIWLQIDLFAVCDYLMMKWTLVMVETPIVDNRLRQK